MRSDCARDDRNLYLNATASVEARSATVKSSPTQGEEKGPAPSNVTTGDGLIESPFVLVTGHLGCNPTTVAVVGREVTVAMPRDGVGGLSGETATCGTSVDKRYLGWPTVLTAELRTTGGLLATWGVAWFGIRD